MDKLGLIVNLLFTTIGVIIIIFFAYFGTRWISTKYKNMTSGKYIKILERIALSQDKMLVLAQLNDKVYFLGISGQHIETITSMDSSELPKVEEENHLKNDFNAIFKELLKNQLPFYKGGNKSDKQ